MGDHHSHAEASQDHEQRINYRPREIRRALGVRAGDRVLFESVGQDVRVRAVKTQSGFSEYRGIGNAGIGSGHRNINAWLRGLRGE